MLAYSWRSEHGSTHSDDYMPLKFHLISHGADEGGFR
jgi:hypothetical protein